MTPLTLTVPMPENVTNRRSGRSHWRVQHREKKAYLARLDVLQATGRLPPPPPAPFARARIRSTMHLGAHMDDDNAMARHKPLLDWLKTRGYVADDRKRNLEWDAFPEQIVRRTGDYRITLTLFPLLP